MTYIIHCSECGRLSDRGCIPICRRCSGIEVPSDVLGCGHPRHNATKDEDGVPYCTGCDRGDPPAKVPAKRRKKKR